MHDVSTTRLYLGNLPKEATKESIEQHFKCMEGAVTEIKLMNGFGFIEYKDPMDARDVVPAFHGSVFMGERLTVQFARGARVRDPNGPSNGERAPPRPRRTQHRMQISGLPTETSWQDLKDFARQARETVIYSEISRDAPGSGFVEFETAEDMNAAVDKLHDTVFPGSERRVACVADPQDEVPVSLPRDPRPRSRSPMRSRRVPAYHHVPGAPYPPPHGYPPHPPPYAEYDRRGPPPRGYTPPRDPYRDAYRSRSPLRRDYYDERPRHYRSPPRRGPPMEEYDRRPHEDPYRRDYVPPPPEGYGRPMYDWNPREYPPRGAPYPPERYPPPGRRYY